MKLLLLASNPDTSSTLNLDREITALQHRFLHISPEPFELVSLPDLRVEEWPDVLRRMEPEVLHVTAHGETSHLVVSDVTANAVEVTAEQLRAFLSPDKPPRLIYFNGCKSADLAKRIIEPVAMAIGTQVTIDNGSARASAVSFYDRVLAGDNVQVAFDAAKAIAAVKSGVKLELFTREGVNAANEVLRPRPRVIIRFARVQRDADGTFPIYVGVTQCPATTTQLVVFFEGEPAPCLTTPPRWSDGAAWLRRELRIGTDRRVFVVGLIGEVARFIVNDQLSSAMAGTESKEVAWAIQQMTRSAEKQGRSA